MSRGIYSLSQEIKRRRVDTDLKKVAFDLGKSTRWVQERLRLLHLCSEARVLVDNGLLGVKSAVLLSFFAPDEQAEHIPAAKRMKHSRFRRYVNEERSFA